MRMGRACSVVLYKQVSFQAQNFQLFFILYSIKDVQINRALCDLIHSVSLIPLFLCRKLQLKDLKSPNMIIQLAHQPVPCPTGLLEDASMEVDKFVPHVTSQLRIWTRIRKSQLFWDDHFDLLWEM